MIKFIIWWFSFSFENIGAHHEFDWLDDNPWDDIMKSDYYYMGHVSKTSQDTNSTERLKIIPERGDNDDEYCEENFQNYKNFQNYNPYSCIKLT